MKTLLICHEGAPLDQVVLARWLNSFSNLVGIVIVQEPASRTWRRIRREVKRIGVFRFLDVLAFRFYYRFFLAREDHRWERQELQQKCLIYGDLASDTAILKTSSPNTQETEAFIRNMNPDIVVARCKVLLKESIFSISARGSESTGESTPDRHWATTPIPLTRCMNRTSSSSTESCWRTWTPCAPSSLRSLMALRSH